MGDFEEKKKRELVECWIETFDDLWEMRGDSGKVDWID